MTTPMTPPADAVARLTKLADDYASRGDFATEDDLRTLLAAYADVARDRERMDSEKKALRIGLRLRDEEAPEVRGRRISVSALFSELEMWLAESPRELVASRIHAQVDAMLDSMLPTEPRALPAARTGEAR